MQQKVAAIDSQPRQRNREGGRGSSQTRTGKAPRDLGEADRNLWLPAQEKIADETKGSEPRSVTFVDLLTRSGNRAKSGRGDYEWYTPPDAFGIECGHG